MTLYPDGYVTEMVTLPEMFARHGGRMHPEFRRRFFAYIEHKGGLLGVGNAWRATQPVKPGAAPEGRSFHQDQRFASGFVGCAAVDLVTTDGPDANNVHDSITWAMTADAPEWGLHTFIKAPVPEPWHIQCIEMRGWQTWVNAGRPDPDPNFVLPGQKPDPLPPIGPIMTTQSEWQQARVADVTFGPGDQLVRIPQAVGKKAATINLHVVTPNHAGFVTAFLGPQPDVSTVNYSPGVVSDGSVTVPVDADGWFALNSTGFVRVLVDLVGVHS